MINILFEVSRTSCRSGECPYEKCIPIKLIRVDERTYKSFEEYNILHGKNGNWTDFGTNHRILENGHIARDIGVEDAYGIEINSLEELIKFYNDVKSEVVIRISWIDNSTPCLEIYDDYRE